MIILFSILVPDPPSHDEGVDPDKDPDKNLNEGVDPDKDPDKG